jgi:hypothetical protein
VVAVVAIVLIIWVVGHWGVGVLSLS